MLCYGFLYYSEDLYRLSIAFPAIFPWTFPGHIYIEQIGFPYNKTLNFHNSGTPGRTTPQLRMEVHIVEKLLPIGIGRYRPLSEL